jgi:signal transduction histidine kinase
LIDVLRRERDELAGQRDRLQEQLGEIRRGAPLPRLVQDMLDQMGAERARLEVERDTLNHKLTDIEIQLQALGIQGGTAGLSQLLAQLYEQRAALQAKSEAFKRERDALLNERAQLEDAIRREAERESRLESLQNEIKHLAADREAVTRQRDRLRVERDEIAARQESLKEQQGRLLAEVAGFEQEILEQQEEQSELRNQLVRLADGQSQLTRERDRLLARMKGVETERDQLMARIEGDRERLQQLGADGIGSLTRMIEELSAQRSELERQLNETRAALASADDRIDMLQLRTTTQPALLPRVDNPELLIGMVQELRTPMTSIVGYIDLLLNESAGILGEMQRKFLQRVSANVSRLALMLEDLTRITALDTGRFALVPEQVDIIEVIEDAITAATNPLREKELALHLDFDEQIAPVRADRDAVSQIVGQLLTNAYLVSPQGSDLFITVRAQLRRQRNGIESIPDRVLVSIEDRGGGIALEDQPRVFARKYKAENPLIQGLGDTGVGLAIARALIEAQGGEIGLESREGVGTTFRFTLPLALQPETER